LLARARHGDGFADTVMPVKPDAGLARMAGWNTLRGIPPHRHDDSAIVLLPLTSKAKLLRSDVLHLVILYACPRIMTRREFAAAGKKGDPMIAPSRRGVPKAATLVECPFGVFHPTTGAVPDPLQASSARRNQRRIQKRPQPQRPLRRVQYPEGALHRAPDRRTGIVSSVWWNLLLKAVYYVCLPMSEQLGYFSTF
jgi:hypothetical protein